jgi:Tfp pilus assembly protein PilW
MKGKKGVTLVELILAAAILAFAITGVLGVFTNCLILNTTNKDLTIASSHAQYVLEKIRNTAFTGLQDAIESGTWNYTSSTINATNLTALSGETITTVPGYSTDPLEVNVTVSWRDQFNRSRNETFTTLIGSS